MQVKCAMRNMSDYATDSSAENKRALKAEMILSDTVITSQTLKFIQYLNRSGSDVTTVSMT